MVADYALQSAIRAFCQAQAEMPTATYDENRSVLAKLCMAYAGKVDEPTGKGLASLFEYAPPDAQPLCTSRHKQATLRARIHERNSVLPFRIYRTCDSSTAAKPFQEGVVELPECALSPL